MRVAILITGCLLVSCALVMSAPAPAPAPDENEKFSALAYLPSRGWSNDGRRRHES